MRRHKGFTLVELITVIVLTGIVGAIGLSFFISLTKGYNLSQDRAKIAADGLLVLEQLAREIRLALPFSVRVSPSGQCIEYFPVVGGATYVGPVPTIQNNAPAISSLTVSPIDTQLNTARYAFIGGLNSDSIYTNASPRSRVALSASPTSNATTLLFASSHIFDQSSVSNRVFLTSHPERICNVTSNQQLEKYINPNTISTTINDTQPIGSTRILLAQNISATSAFSVSAGNDQENITVTIELNFSEGQQSVLLSKTVPVRNSP